MTTWDPSTYLAFADHRTRPFVELTSAVDRGPDDVARLVDLGCGPGHLTSLLRRRWPRAEILALDSSPEMIARARSGNDDDRVRYEVADVTTWIPPEPPDLIVSNAMFQWVDDQWAVLDRLIRHLSPAGVLALSVPNNADQPSHRLLYDLADRDPYRAHLADARRLAPLGPERYLEFFTGLGLTVDAWSTTYLQVLDGDDPVFEWVSGTGARPFLQGLDDGLRGRFADEYRAALRDAYPVRESGTVFPFTRTFAVASRA
ncbi:trans-aconitate 2-methyltransferase [Gordonia araii NBRC 100433]|uniref:Trans-aconitate 2-methyltransferase n=1 Tax=Gordonia araii NBRC 100433 TaxID=1073574 RepID=G7H6G9_9ACTN|nr:methyltransferase domain-containing protein [Gordonia araii]NNG96124.1 methyltransferase domain-containing protein [Gordonia araii NBRC 100433]GAB11444.1 trans-aconitate 2-methyltransferase [Gordonia araii NBRC 100433]